MIKALSILTLLIAGTLVAGPLQLTLPPVIYGVEGQPVSLYFDNIVLTEKPESYKFEISCDVGATETRRWTSTPNAQQVGEHLMKIVIKDGDGKVLDEGSTKLVITPKNSGSGKSLRLLIVGDSLTAATHYPNEMGRLLSLPDNPKWTMMGTARREPALPGVVHEGYGGWKWIDFISKWTPEPKGVTAGPLARKSTSPFLFANDKGQGEMDLPRYFKENGGQPPDVVTFLLGINDCFGAPTDDPAAMDKHINAVLDNADKLLAAFHKAAPKAVLAVGLTTPPNARESGFEANYKGKYHRWGWKRIQHRLVQVMQQRLSHREKENIYLVPTEINLDPVDGYPANNGVHPNEVGYAQIGFSFYVWLKHWMATQLR